MNESDNNEQGKKKVNEVKTFSVPLALEPNNENVAIDATSSTKPTKEQIISQAIQFHAEGNISEARKYYQYFLDQGFSDPTVFSNYGIILKDIGKLKEAEVSIRKAIKLNPNFADAYINLGCLLKDTGKLKEAEISVRKAIEIKPEFAEAYSILGAILKDIDKLEEAEISLRKAITLKPNAPDAYVNLGGLLKDIGKLKEAEIFLRKAIALKPDFAEAYSNLGNVLKDLYQLEEAEVLTRKAITLKSDFADFHYNLGSILKDLGRLEEAEKSITKAIELKPDFTRAYFSVSTLNYSGENKIWEDKLFSENILNNKSKKELVDIYFARANIYHNIKRYKDSSKNLILANNFKLEFRKSQPEILMNKSKSLLIECDKKEIIQKDISDSPDSIFIVGMFRSGSTLVESILSINNNVDDLGEINILEESYLEYKNTSQKVTLYQLYSQKVKELKSRLNITTNKYLYNFQYTGIILDLIPNAKIIHCFRNPLDNILSIYRAHFDKGIGYSSSLADCTRVYLDLDEIMTEYKSRFRSKIYDLNYDVLVRQPEEEIRSLISWLGWKWEDRYLSPHLNNRSIFTASSIQARSPINSKSIGGWKNYKDMLLPVVEILKNSGKCMEIT